MKIFYVILSVLLCCSCQHKQEEFEIEGHIRNYTGNCLYVRYETPVNQQFFNDTIEVHDGKFTYTGHVDCPQMFYFVPQDFTGRYELFVENNRIQAEAVYGVEKVFHAEGSSSHDEYISILHDSESLLTDYRLFQYRMNAQKENEEVYAAMQDSVGIWAGRLLDFLKCRKNYSTSMVLPFFAMNWIEGDDVKRMGDFLSGLGNEAKEGVYAAYCLENWQRECLIQPGNQAYDFQLQDTCGKVYSLSDYRGKYVLFEFSASWCGWCKKEIPYLKEVYKIGEGKNFQMFTINMDKDRADWIADVAKEDLPWPVLADGKAFESEMAKKYNVHGIPMIFLIGPDGKIISSKLRGDKMIKTIQELLK